MQKDTINTKMRRQVTGLLRALEEQHITRSDMEYVLPLFLANVWANLDSTQNIDNVAANMDALKVAVVKYLESKGWKPCQEKLN